MSKILRPQKRKVYLMHYDGGTYTGDKWDIARQANISVAMVSHYISNPGADRYGEPIGHKWPIYDFYRVKSGKYTGTGTMVEMAERLRIKLATLTYGGDFKKLFTGEYKIVEEDELIQKRTFSKHAAKPENVQFETAKPKTRRTLLIHKPARIKPFKFSSRWINYQVDGMFRGW